MPDLETPSLKAPWCGADCSDVGSNRSAVSKRDLRSAVALFGVALVLTLAGGSAAAEARHAPPPRPEFIEATVCI